MDIEIKKTKTRKQCLEPEIEFCWNVRLVEWIAQRMYELHSAPNLLTIKNITNANFHPLQWERKCEIAIDAIVWGKRSKERIIFKPTNWEYIFDDMYNDKKLQTVTSIEILEISIDHYKK